LSDAFLENEVVASIAQQERFVWATETIESNSKIGKKKTFFMYL
jgi:hypothetical protein